MPDRKLGSLADTEPQEPQADILDEKSRTRTDGPDPDGFDGDDSSEGFYKVPKESKSNKDDTSKEGEPTSPRNNNGDASEGEKNSLEDSQRTTDTSPTSIDVQPSIYTSSKPPVALPEPSRSPPPLAPPEEEKMVPLDRQEPISHGHSPQPSNTDSNSSEDPQIDPGACLPDLQDAMDSDLLDDSAVRDREIHQQAMKTMSELDREAPLMYPFKHRDIYQEYFTVEGNVYKPYRYLGSNSDNPEMELLTYYTPDGSRNAIDVRPRQPSSAGDTYQPPKDMLRQVGDDGWEERLTGRLGENDWNYLEDLSERMSDGSKKRQQGLQRRLEREAVELERKQEWERERESRQIESAEEKRKEEQQEAFEGRPREFYIVEDAQNNRRWVVAEKNVEIPENLVYLDQSAYKFTNKVTPNPHPQYKDPRDQYTTRHRSFWDSYPCDKERRCACFKQNLECPTTVLFKTGDGRGVGLRALRDIKEGDYIGEFRGDIEIRNNNEKREKLLQEYEDMDMRYAAGGHWDEHTDFGVDENGNELSFSYYIDAKYAGNETRFINHHCDPDNVNSEYFQENHKGRMYLAIRAIRHIYKGEEILLDYGTTNDWTVHSGTCLCGSERCRYFAILNNAARGTYAVRITDENGENPRDVLVEPDSVEEPFIAKSVIKPEKKMKPYWVRYKIDNTNRENNKLDWPSNIVVHVIHYMPRVKEKKLNKFDELMTRRAASSGRMMGRLADLYAEKRRQG
ncbi:SET domain-containing protein [Wilcoxina mikolae CBS 423.85]|nr:SET domain-containing protein [Wilcoxina mikolae CBS 423.85]